MSVISELETLINDLECENKSLISEYKNALSILKDEKLITSGTFENVINDLAVSILFDESKKDEYISAIEKLRNASI